MEMRDGADGHFDMLIQSRLLHRAVSDVIIPKENERYVIMVSQ